MHKTIKKGFTFLVDNYGYTYHYEYKKNIYHTCVFSNADSVITINHDSRCDHLALNISKNNKLIVDIYYYNIVWGEGVHTDGIFAQNLKDIYSSKGNKNYFSFQQFNALIELICDFVYRNIDFW